MIRTAPVTAYHEVRKWQREHGRNEWGGAHNWLLGLAALMDDETRRLIMREINGGEDVDKHSTCQSGEVFE